MTEDEPLSGELFAGRFVVERRAGAGGMAVVYRAFDRVAERVVALKVLRKVDASTLRRFENEAQTLGSLEHPGIVGYLAHGISDDRRAWLAMEWVDGGSLATRLDGDASPTEVVDLGRRLAGALADAHALGVVHRDVKPSNVLLVDGRLDRPKIIDFGIARPATLPAHRNTATGMILGTMGYMAPEQSEGVDDLDGRADVFSLGCLLFRALTGVEAFDGAAPLTVLAKSVLLEPPRVRSLRSSVPAALDDLVGRMLAKDRDARPASASEVERELGRIRAGIMKRRRARRASWALAIGVVVCMLGVFRCGDGIGLRTANARERSVKLTDLQPSAICAPAAASAFRSGLEALRAADWESAQHRFEDAQRADGACPEVELRLVVTGEMFEPLARQHEQLRRALRHRDALSERDRYLLDAMTAIVGGERPLQQEAVRLFDEAARRFPRDAELAVLSEWRKHLFHSRSGTFEEGLARTETATRIDPGYADAWQLSATLLGSLGRHDEQLVALDRCIEVARSATDCMKDRSFVLRRLGRCDDAIAQTRRWIEVAPRSSSTHLELALGLAAVDAPRAEVEAEMEKRWALLSDGRREGLRRWESARLAAWYGDFEGALRMSIELERWAAREPSRENHGHGLGMTANVLLELGRDREAADAAERLLARREAWIREGRDIDAETYAEPQMLFAQLRGGRIGRTEWLARGDAWDRAHERMSAFERWALRWGPAAGSDVDVTGAIAALPPSAVGGPSSLALQLGILEGYAGSIHLSAGDPAHAMPLLQASERTCRSFDLPFIDMHVHLASGEASERLGHVDDACRSYERILARWGDALPPSVTAASARRRSRALGCREQ